MRSAWVCRPGAAEFPHDNPRLERCAIWVGSALCEAEAPPRAELTSREELPTTLREDVDTTPPAAQERINVFVRTIREVARAHGAAETAAHIESLFKFGVPAPIELHPHARAALFEGNILEATDGKVHATAWFTATSTVWQNILRGEPGDLSACGESTLDSWTADLIARVVAKPGMAATIRRDLRRRGIAAFGMLD